MRQELNRKLVNYKISFVYLSANCLERFRFNVEAERLRQNKNSSLLVCQKHARVFKCKNVLRDLNRVLLCERQHLPKAKTTHTSNTKISVHE